MRLISPMRFAINTPAAQTPAYATHMAAGLDLCCVAALYIPPQQVLMSNTGIVVELPAGTYGLLRLRSGLASKYALSLASSGIIDSDYRGEIIVPIFNNSTVTRYIDAGTRIAQLVVQPYIKVAPIRVDIDKLSTTLRGKGGFGSTGMGRMQGNDIKINVSWRDDKGKNKLSPKPTNRRKESKKQGKHKKISKK